MAWLVGLISPTAPAPPPCHANQMLPSGPAVIPLGCVIPLPRLETLGKVNSLIAWVVGLISPTLLADVSVNQRLPSEPAAIP